MFFQIFATVKIILGIGYNNFRKLSITLCSILFLCYSHIFQCVFHKRVTKTLVLCASCLLTFFFISMQLDSDKRLCIIAIRTPYIFFKLHATFPMKYPDRAPPTFNFSQDSQIGDESRKNIVNVRQRNKENKNILQRNTIFIFVFKDFLKHKMSFHVFNNIVINFIFENFVKVYLSQHKQPS